MTDEQPAAIPESADEELVRLRRAMTYDKTVNAIGPFELTEYFGLGLVWGALAVTAPFRTVGRPVPVTG